MVNSPRAGRSWRSSARRTVKRPVGIHGCRTAGQAAQNSPECMVFVVAELRAGSLLQGSLGREDPKAVGEHLTPGVHDKHSSAPTSLGEQRGTAPGELGVDSIIVRRGWREIGRCGPDFADASHGDQKVELAKQRLVSRQLRRSSGQHRPNMCHLRPDSARNLTTFRHEVDRCFGQIRGFGQMRWTLPDDAWNETRTGKETGRDSNLEHLVTARTHILPVLSKLGVDM